MAPHLEVLFPALQKTLLDQSDEVVQQCLVVIAEIVSPYLENVLNESGECINFTKKSEIFLFVSDSTEWNFLKEFWKETDSVQGNFSFCSRIIKISQQNLLFLVFVINGFM